MKFNLFWFGLVFWICVSISDESECKLREFSSYLDSDFEEKESDSEDGGVPLVQDNRNHFREREFELCYSLSQNGFAQFDVLVPEYGFAVFEAIAKSSFFRDLDTFSAAILSAIKYSCLHQLVCLEAFPKLFFKYINQLDVNYVKEVIHLDPFIKTSDGKNLMHHALIQENFELFSLLPRKVEYLLSADENDKYSFEYLNLKNDINFFFLDQIFDIFITGSFGENAKRLLLLNRVFTVTSFQNNPQIDSESQIIPDKVFKWFVIILTSLGRTDLMARLKSKVSGVSEPARSSKLFFIYVVTSDYKKVKRLTRNNPLISFNGSNILHLAIQYHDETLVSLVPPFKSYLTHRDSKRKLPSDYISTKTDLDFIFSRFIQEFGKLLTSLLNIRDPYKFNEYFPQLEEFYEQFAITPICFSELDQMQQVALSMFFATLHCKDKDCYPLQCLLIHIVFKIDTRFNAFIILKRCKLGHVFRRCIDLDLYDLIEFILKLNPIVAYECRNILHYAALKHSIRLFEMAPETEADHFLFAFDKQNKSPLNYLQSQSQLQLQESPLDLDELTERMIRRSFLELNKKTAFIRIINDLFPFFMMKNNNCFCPELFSEFLAHLTPLSLDLKYCLYKCITENYTDLLQIILSVHKKWHPNFYKYFHEILTSPQTTTITFVHYEIFLKCFSDILMLLNFVEIITVLRKNIYQIDRDDIVASFLKKIYDFDQFYGSHYLRVIYKDCPDPQKKHLEQLILSSCKNINISRLIRSSFMINYMYDDNFMINLRNFHKDLAQSSNILQEGCFSDILPNWIQKNDEPIHQRSVNPNLISLRLEDRKFAPEHYSELQNICDYVQIVEHKTTKQVFVIKSFKETQRISFSRECNMLMYLDDCSYFYKVFAFRCSISEPRWQILYEYVKCPSKHFAQQASVEELQSISAQLFLGLEHLHWLRIVHSDIKPDNVMITADKNVKIIDFGISFFLDSDKYSKCGCTPNTMAPEYADFVPGIYDEAVDWWAYGSTVAIWYGKNIHFSDVESDGPDSFAPFYYVKDKSAYRVGKVPRKFPSNLRAFLKIFFQPNPSARRLNTKRLLQQIRDHPFFEGINWVEMPNGVLDAEDIILHALDGFNHQIK